MTTKATTLHNRRPLGQTLRALSALSLFPLAFAACTEDELAVAAPEAEAFAQEIRLAPAPAEWVTIEGTEEADLGTEAMARGRGATRAGGNNRGRFNIDLKFALPVTPEQESVFEAAAARWERIIIRDVPSFTGTLPSAFEGFPPAVDGTVDDILIEVVLAPIDGPGSILGQAGPRFVRTSDFLTLTGVMFFDVDDLDFLDDIGLFEEVIVHEMGHVLGVGTLWDVPGRDLRKDEEGNPYFAGKRANIFWNAEGGTFELPVEDQGGPGTALGHWRESVLRNELMTGFLNLGENPLSRITAGSMRDLGYGSASVGERFDLPRGAEGVNPDDGDTDPAGISDANQSGDHDHALHIAAREILLQPIGSVTVK